MFRYHNSVRIFSQEFKVHFAHIDKIRCIPLPLELGLVDIAIKVSSLVLQIPKLASFGHLEGKAAFLSRNNFNLTLVSCTLVNWSAVEKTVISAIKEGVDGETVKDRTSILSTSADSLCFTIRNRITSNNKLKITSLYPSRCFPACIALC